MGHQLGSLSAGHCPKGCGIGKPEGLHFSHEGGPCTWHDGTCEEANMDESLWCQCGRDELAHKLWREVHPVKAELKGER